MERELLIHEHPVARPFSIFRILLAVLLCGGLCRLDWGHIHEHGRPERRSQVHAIQAVAYKHGALFATRFSETAGLHAVQAKSNQGASVLTFEFANPFVICAPREVIESRVNLKMAVVASSRGEGMGNKDPPPSTRPA